MSEQMWKHFFKAFFLTEICKCCREVSAASKSFKYLKWWILQSFQVNTPSFICSSKFSLSYQTFCGWRYLCHFKALVSFFRKFAFQWKFNSWFHAEIFFHLIASKKFIQSDKNLKFELFVKTALHLRQSFTINLDKSFSKLFLKLSNLSVLSLRNSSYIWMIEAWK